MGQFLPFHVEVIDRGQRHDLADFRRVSPAISAAKMSLLSPTVSLACVRDREGVMVYVIDSEREWMAEGLASAPKGGGALT